MTSRRFNEARAKAQAEMELFDRLPYAIQTAMKAAPLSLRAQTVWDALVRGVSEKQILETITAAKKRTEPQ